MKTMDLGPEHSLDLNNIDRTWTDRMGFAHVICQCGRQFIGVSDDQVMEYWLAHFNREMGIVTS